MNILVEYPKNKKIKFLFSSYPTQELTGRERVVKENLRLPFETKHDMFMVVETDLMDLPDSLQCVLKDSLKITENDTLIFRAFQEDSTKSLNIENNMDIYNLVYSEFDWNNKVKNKKLN